MRNRDIAAGLAGLMFGAAVLRKAVRSRRAMDLSGQVVVVTGGSRGLGLLLARELARQGARVMLAARDEYELVRARRELRSEGLDADTIVADVGTESGAQAIADETVARFGRIDVLINNAGVIKVGPFEHMTKGDFQEAMDVHFWGPLYTTRAVIPHMQRQGGGRIVNIASVGGKLGVPHMVPYCASKFALVGASTAMRAELARDGIVVTTVSPGLMRTGSPFNASFKGRHRQEFAWFAIADSLPLLTIDGGRAASAIVDALKHGDAELVVSWPARLGVAAAAAFPGVVAGAMAVVNRLLPGPVDGGDRTWSGWQSGSYWAPSILTRLTEQAAAHNNEVAGSH